MSRPDGRLFSQQELEQALSLLAGAAVQLPLLDEIDSTGPPGCWSGLALTPDVLAALSLISEESNTTVQALLSRSPQEFRSSFERCRTILLSRR